MRCPYLTDTTRKMCAKMFEAQLSAELSSFDIRNFCDGNPHYCYYFRLPQTEETTQTSTKSEKQILMPQLLNTEKIQPLPIKVCSLKP